MSSKLTLDYGVRFVHMQPQYDSLGQASNFLPEKWSQGQAPVLFVAGCVNNANPCSGSNRQAKNPLTGQLLGSVSSAAIGTIVPNTGNALNGLYLSGDGITETTYTYRSLGIAPRFGIDYDLTGEQRVVLRGGGLFYDRPNGNDIYAQVTNPPAVQNVTVRYAQLQSLSSGISTVGAPTLNVYQYDAKLPSSWQWNGGVQMTLPWSTSLDLAYTGQHSWNTPQAVNRPHHADGNGRGRHALDHSAAPPVSGAGACTRNGESRVNSRMSCTAARTSISVPRPGTDPTTGVSSCARSGGRRSRSREHSAAGRQIPEGRFRGPSFAVRSTRSTAQ